ncbi:hypothetical protein, partial [Escherichia coli]
ASTIFGVHYSLRNFRICQTVLRRRLPFILFSRIFYYTTRFIYALKFAVAMTIANMGYQALCLYIDNSFAITRISPLWAGLIGVCTFIAALLLTSKR